MLFNRRSLSWCEKWLSPNIETSRSKKIEADAKAFIWKFDACEDVTGRFCTRAYLT